MEDIKKLDKTKSDLENQGIKSSEDKEKKEMIQIQIQLKLDKLQEEIQQINKQQEKLKKVQREFDFSKPLTDLDSILQN